VRSGIVQRRAIAVALVLAMGLVACGVQADDGALPALASGKKDPNGGVVGSDIEPTTSTTAPATTTTPTPVDIDVTGDDGSEVNSVAANAIEDIQAFWKTEYPKVFDRPYRPVAGGFYAIDSSTDPSGLPCAVDDINQVLNNAYYCPPDDAVVWDQEGLMPDLAKQYGDFTVAVVLAHEWGHAIQDRAAINEPTVVLELQADCFAGAWVKHVRSDKDTRFKLSTEDLDLSMAGILSLRDAPGSLADDPNAHGSGFDRVGAFQEGYENGATRCATFKVGDPAPYQFPFSESDEATGGDLQFHGTSDDPGIDVEAFVSLEKYWADAFPLISGGKPWKSLNAAEAFSPDDPPTCDGEKVTDYRLFLCVPDNYVGFDSKETMPQAYEFGDFAVGTLFATQYGLAVENELGLKPKNEVEATLWGDCYAGSWAGALLPDEVNQTDFPYQLLLSPGDLDEAVAVLLSFRTDSDRQRQGPGFDRVKAFRSGVVHGPRVCSKIEASE